MNSVDLCKNILSRIENGERDPEVYEDMNQILKELEMDACDNMDGSALYKKNRSKLFNYVHEVNKEVRRYLGDCVRESKGDVMGHFFDLYKRSLLMDSPYDFDSYMLYLEMKRNVADRFYQNRRKVIRPFIEQLQRISDWELDELFLSCPPRVGKTSLLIFFLTWQIGRFSEFPNLYSSYSDKITTAFYNGILEIMSDDDTYAYHDIFPHSHVVRSDSKDLILDFDRKKHYPTLTCRSLYGTLNGACDAEKGIIIADDLIGGIEEALNKDRLTSAWYKVDNNLIPRGKGGTRFIWCGTRWSIMDPAGVRMDLLENDETFRNHKYFVINIPALNEKDESNFDYDNGVGFDTLYYKQRRASFERNNDMASWSAQYMGQPVEREGSLFSPNDFRYYNGVLPEGKPDRIFMAVDPAYGGGDYVASPVCMQYGEDIYVPGVVYDNGDKKVTQPLLVNAVEKYTVQAMQIEASKSTESYKNEVEELLNSKGLKLNMSTKAAPPTGSKMDRICARAPDIRDHFIFLESGKRNKEYSMFMMNVFSYKLYAKKQHDDAPDSLAQAADVAYGKASKKPEFFRRFL